LAVGRIKTTAKKRYPNVSTIARLACSNSLASAFDYLPKWCVSTDVRYQKAHGVTSTTRRVRFRQQAALPPDHVTRTGDQFSGSMNR
jgi:hypothetical protein